MQVDPSPMNVGDGGTVNKESSALKQLSESMVGNPQQTLPPELRGDVPHGQQNKLRTSTDCKMPSVCSDKASKTSNSNHCPEVPPSHLRNNSVFNTDSFSTPLPDRTEVPKAQAEGAAAYPAQHWPCGKKVGSEDLMTLVNNSATQNKKAPHNTGPTQPVISLSPGFQCSTLFKPGQPVAFLPSPNFASSLCKITLPPGLGQIAALREATASQFQKDCPVSCPGSSATPRLKTYPLHFSMGRGIAEKKPLSSASKGRCEHVSNAKGCKGVGEHKSTISSSVSPAIPLPAQQATQASAPLTHYTISPTAAICCSSALANITTQNRLLSLVEKCPPYRGIEKTSVAYLKPKTVSSTEDHSSLCPEARDVPLDLSSKSKRQKSIKDAQSSPTTTTEQCLFEPHQKNSHASKRPQTSTYGSASTFAILPDTQRNGSAQRSTSKLSNHNLEPSASWGKGSSQGSLNNLPGTYVGVASPILASTLRSKDGKSAAFVEDVQIFAKQETISIIDQGEQLASRSKKTPSSVKGERHNKGDKQSGSTSASTTASGVQELPSKPLFTSTSLQSPRTSGGKAGVSFTPPGKPLWPQPLFQGMSLQKRPSQSQAPSKVKGNLSCDGPLFHKCELSPTNVKDEKWEKTHSPLSNLESIVKQKALETTALTGETYCNLSTVGSRKPDVVNLLSRSQNPPVQQTVATCFTPGGISEPQDSRTISNTPLTDASVDNRQDATAVFLPKEKCHDKQAKLLENFTGQKSELSSPKKRCASSSKVGKKESMLAPDPEEKTREDPAIQMTPNSKLESISIPQPQTNTEAEKKINGGKKDRVSKGNVPITKQKKPRKKEKTSPETLKKTATLKKKPQMKESATDFQAPTSKKKKGTTTEKSPLKESPLKQSTCPIPEDAAKIHKGKSLSVKTEQPPCNKSDFEKSSVRSVQVEPAPITKNDQPSKETNLQQVSSPRPKRGRRRTDDALLRDWSFASPPTPPPPLPPPPPPPPPPESFSSPLLPNPVFPLRRPRGRPRLNPLPESGDTDNTRPVQVAKGGDLASAKKRKRCRNRKYQNGEYITDKEKEANRENKEKFENGENEETDMDPPLSGTLPYEDPNSDLSPKKSLTTRSGTMRHQESPSTPEFNDKPPGKRKFKSKHLCDTEEQKKLKIKRGLAGKRSSSLSTDEDSPMAKKPSNPLSALKESSSPVPKKKGPGKGGVLEPTPSRPVPPEVRRLIVNKNAGETLLQRAARLGYQEVVLYCLEKDVREVNRRDNAGYTALHEACARGWTHIVQVLLKHGADVNCSAQDGTRPIHDAVAADSLAAVWMLLNHGADPTLATYSGQTAVKLAQSPSMKTFLKEYFTDLEGRPDQDPSLQWDFYSSSVFETDQEACWDFLLAQPEDEDKEEWREQGKEKDTDCLLFEFSSEPLLPCYHVQVSLTQGFCNWFLLMDVLKRLKVSARIFHARYPQFEVVSLTRAELWRQVSVSQTCIAPDELRPVDEEEDDETVELVRCVPELQGLFGSSIQLLQDDDNDDERSEVISLCNR